MSEQYKLSLSGSAIEQALQRATPGGAIDLALSANAKDHTHRNLLDNWDFRNPVNQRGQTSYSGLAYAIDRWKINWDTYVSVDTGYVTLSGKWNMEQTLEEPLPMGTYTFSVKISDHCGDDLSLTLKDSSGNALATSTISDASGVFSVSCTSDSLNKVCIAFVGGSSNSVRLYCTKLELGSTSTLTNDPPADYGGELFKCQRFFQVVHRYSFFIVGALNTNTYVGQIPLPVPLRVSPTITFSSGGSINVGGTTGWTPSCAVSFNDDAYLRVNFSKTSHGLSWLQLAEVTGGNMYLSSDL